MDVSLDIAGTAYNPGKMLILRVSVDQTDLAARADVQGVCMQEADTTGAQVSGGDEERGLLVIVKQLHAYASYSVPVALVPAPRSQHPVQSLVRFAVLIQLVEDFIDVCGVESASYTNGFL